MKRSMIEELYYSNLGTPEKEVIKGSEYKKMQQELNKLCSNLESKLDSEEYKLFTEILDMQNELNGIDLFESFSDGFTIGTRLSAESFIGESSNYRK